MTTTSSTPLAATFTVLTPSGRRDVRLGSAATVAGLLAVLALPSDTVLISSDGSVLQGSEDLEGLRGGEILTVVTAEEAHSEHQRPARTQRSVSPAALLWSVAAAFVAVALVRAVELAVGSEATVGVNLAAALSCAAVALLLAFAGRRDALTERASAAVTAGCVSAGAAAGLFAVPPGLLEVQGMPALLIPVTISLLAASIAAALRYARAQGAAAAVGAGVVLTFTVVLAAAAALTVMVGVGPAAPAAVLLGVAPIVVRALPAGSLDVPDHVVVDLEAAQRTATTVRQRSVISPDYVRSSSVERSITAARTRRTWAVIVLSIVVVILAPLVLLAPLPALVSWAANVQLWATGGLGAAVALALVLIPRQERLPSARIAPRLAAAFVLALTALWFARVLEAWAVIGIAATVAAALTVVSALALGRGWRSVRWSRTADSVESLMVALAPALGLLAAGALAWLRLLASG